MYVFQSEQSGYWLLCEGNLILRSFWTEQEALKVGQIRIDHTLSRR